MAKESISPKETQAKAPTIGGQGAANPMMAGMAVAGGVPQMGAAPSEAYVEAQGEMPF